MRETPRRSDEITAGLSFWLDALRGMAALLVVLAHARFHTFGAWGGDISGLPEPVAALFFALTGMGHEAVVLFFVMSGFLIAPKHPWGSAYAPRAFARYAVSRLSRLWVVAIPAVLFSVVVSYALIAMTGSNYAAGLRDCAPGLREILLALTFLNEGYGPTLCSNKPFWSIHSEAHYYFMWPALVFALSGAVAVRRRWICALALILVVAALLRYDTFDIKNTLILSVVWGAGLAVFPVSRLALLRRIPLIVPLGLVAVLMAAPSIDAWARLWPLSDYALAGAVVVFLGRARYARLPAVPVRRVATWLAQISFSLYLTHIVVINTVRSILKYRFDVGFEFRDITPASLAIFAVMIVLSIAVAQVFWWSFERHTADIREGVARWLRIGGRKA